MKRVCVLMSTYNGEKYIKEQLDSVLLQYNVELSLLIRDDGSHDRTIEVIESYSSKHTNMRLIKGRNIGPAMSFLTLVKEAPEADYYAFCDQDDVWIENKLDQAIKKIMGEEDGCLPVLYYSNLIITDSKLSPIRRTLTRKPNKKKLNKYIPLVDNLATGCTMVMNKQLASMIASHLPSKVTMHDAWCNIVCSLFGKVVFDEQSYIYYRQHGNNTIGMETRTNPFRNMQIHIARLSNKKLQPRLMNAKSALECFDEELTEEDKNKLFKMTHYKESVVDRLLLLFDMSIHSYSLLKDLRYRFLILLGEI